jgi:catechol 2,3-dioxygenase-like lactoylglutathione lyase family enzyme
VIGMIPVLAVKDPVAARQTLERQFGFQPLEAGRMGFGDSAILLVAEGQQPDGLIALDFDHIAFRVPDADACLRDFQAAGASLDPRFTPNGPRNIPEFWNDGVRFVFFKGPDGTALDFCAQNDPAATKGHSHFAIRTADLEGTATRLQALGARQIAAHSLAGPVSVRFLQAGNDIFELFDEAPFNCGAASTGWIGLLPH